MSAETSPAGEADSGSTANDKDSSVDCPTCGKECSSELGVKQHHAKTHGESLTKQEKPCDNCGETITVHDYELDRQEHHFCDRDCSSTWQENQIEVECEICGEHFEVIKFREDTAACCSRECRIEKTRQITGDQRYNYKTQTYECRECGAEVERQPSMVYSEDRVFCGNECFDEFRRIGYSQNYGRNWNQQRRKALKRDQYRCQACGITHADLNYEPHVHHIQPASSFKDKFPEPDWWERANRLSNLITLCSSCHRTYEVMAPLIPEFN